MKQKIAIVGAGLSGLVTAKTMLEYGHEVTVFEKEGELGGVWASCRHYPGLTTQNTRDTYAFSDFRMPKHYPEFPSGRQMLDYLTAYADHFGLTQHIRFQHRIDAAEPSQTAGGSAWIISGTHAGKLFTAEADFLIVCNGTFSEPYLPPAEGMDAFRAGGGVIQHTSTLGLSAPYAGKKVVVVGYGKSACDVASAIADTAQETSLVYRQAKWKVPKRIMGINYKYLLLSRFGEALTKFKYRNGLEKFIHGIGLPGKALGSMEGVFARQQQLKECGLVPATSIVDQLFGELSVETDGFFQKVIDGKIKAIQGEIHSYFPGGVVLSGGERLEADMVVYGTGFSQNIPFLSAQIQKNLCDRAGNYLLYRNLLPLHTPGLAFNGYNTSFFCNLSSEMGALWLAEYRQGNLRLPSPLEMEAQVTEHLEWRMQFRKNGLFRNAGVYPFNITYVDQLLRDMNAGLSLGALLSEWLVVLEPSNYAPVKRKIRARNGNLAGVSVKKAGIKEETAVETAS